jgi:hypothetical protein
MSEPYNFAEEAEELVYRARGGDEEAARLLVFAGQIFASSLSDLLYGPGQGAELIKRLAAESLTWPCIASNYRRMQGHPEALAKYLNEVGLGTGRNLNSEKQDKRTLGRLEGAFFFFRAIEDRGKIDLKRDGINDRDEWMKSDYGKAVKEEIAAILDEYFRCFSKDFWRGCDVLKALAECAYAAAESEVNSAGRSAPRLTMNRIVPDIEIARTALVKEIARLIHSMLLA